MSHPYINAIRAGALVDLTQMMLGRRAAYGGISITCSKTFFETVITNSKSAEYLKLLAFLTRAGEFTFIHKSKVVKCRCVHRRETIDGKEVSCFTFFTCNE